MTENELSRRELIAGGVAAGVAIASTSAFAQPATTSAASPRTTTDMLPDPVMTGDFPVSLNINGKTYDLKIDPRATLLDALRESLHLTGTKKGCDHGQCGACTVHVDGQRVLSCLTLAAQVAGSEVTSIEGLAKGDELHPLQQAFVKHDALQCGYCTSGQIMSGVACINEGHCNSRDEIREYMSGNLCRCGAYPNIVDAILEAAGK